MMKVAIIALLTAPCALAYSPDDLRGVWSCTIEDATKLKSKQKKCTAALCAVAATEQVWEEYSSNDRSDNRVVVFDLVKNDKATRRFKGRTYYTSGSDVEEHNFHGYLLNGVDGEFFLDANFYNAECLAVKTAAVAATTTTTAVAAVPGTDSTADSIALNLEHPVIAPGAYVTKTDGDGYSCATRADGPWKFTMDDIDHFTLQVDPSDMQLDHYLTDSSAIPRIFSIEKCMRGLPEESRMCNKLARSDIESNTEKDDACQGILECHETSGSETWGCDDEACCDLRPAPTFQAPQQQYYYPQPQYYQQPYAQYQPYQSNPFQANAPQQQYQQFQLYGR